MNKSKFTFTRFYLLIYFIIIAFASTAGGLRNRNAAAFTFLKKYAGAFF